MTGLHVSRRRWAKIPIEIAGRELDAKVLLAGVLADAGWGVLIGQQNVVRAAALNGGLAGIQHEKSIASGMAPDIAAAHAGGMRITACCEEGLVYLDPQAYVRRKIARENLAKCEAFFCWGAQQADDLAAALGERPTNLVISGNPRIDLLSPAVRNYLDRPARAISDRIGRFVLVNTNFGRFNPFIGREQFYANAKGRWGLIRTPEEDANFKAIVRHQELMFEKTIALVEELAAKLGGMQVVLRPHSAESREPYFRRLGSTKKVRIETAGSANEWILASVAMIHHTCTTSVEAFLLGRPSISYMPYDEPTLSAPLPRQLSLRCRTLEDVLRAVERATRGQPIVEQSDTDRMMRIAGRCMANVDGPMAVDEMLRRLSAIESREQPLRIDGIAREAFAGVGDGPAAHTHVEETRGPAPGRSVKEYRRQKFPSVSVLEVAGIVTRLSNATGRFRDVRIVGLSEDLFCLFRA